MEDGLLMCTLQLGITALLTVEGVGIMRKISYLLMYMIKCVPFSFGRKYGFFLS